MSKAVMLSIRPKWCEKIASGEKTIEVRKNRPKLAPPFKCYIYCTRDKHLAFMQNQMGANLIACMDAETAIPVGGFIGNGKIIGEFMCKGFIPFSNGRPCFVAGTPEEIERMACLTRKEIWEYAPQGNPIEDIVQYMDEDELLHHSRPLALAYLALTEDASVPVVHARWAHLGGDEWCCSACGFVITTEGSWDKPTKKYCEDCGAKMDGAE